MKTIVALAFVILAVGCKSPEEKCIDSQVERSKRRENCGLMVTLTKDEARKRCAEDAKPENKEWVADQRFIDAGETCEAMKVRAADVAARMRKKTAEQAWKDFAATHDISGLTPEQIEQLKRVAQ
jgi:hypothetical protein